MSWRSVVSRGFIALFGTFVFSLALVAVIGHADWGITIWMLTFAFAWVVWVWLPERNVSTTRWWLTKTAQFAAVVLALFLLAVLVQLAVSPS